MPFPSQYGTVNKSVHQHNLQMAVQKVHVPQQDKGQWVPWVSSLLGFRQGLRRGVREEKGAGKPGECMSTQIKAALQEARYWRKAQTACRASFPSEVTRFAPKKREEKGSKTSSCPHAFVCPQSPQIQKRWESSRQGPGLVVAPHPAWEGTCFLERCRRASREQRALPHKLH